jgi:hypothetical protein
MPSCHCGLHTPCRRILPKSSPQNRYNLHRRVRERGLWGHVRKAARLAYWNSDSIRGRKLELERFLREYGIDICLLSEIHLEPARTLRLANYVCHRKNRPARRGGRGALVRRDIDYYAVPVSDLQQLEAITIYEMWGNMPVELGAAYLSPTRTLTECLSGGYLILLAGDLNAKH